MQANAEYLKTNPDYLAMMGPPEDDAPAAPIATEDFTIPDEEAPPVPGYLNMNIAKNSPMLNQNRSDIIGSSNKSNNKTSPIAKPPRKSKEKQKPGEDIPMLKNSTNVANEESDNEIETEYKDLMPHPRESIAKNQYVNVPSKELKRLDAISNPSYVTVSNVNERS